MERVVYPPGRGHGREGCSFTRLNPIPKGKTQSLLPGLPLANHIKTTPACIKKKEEIEYKIPNNIYNSKEIPG